MNKLLTMQEASEYITSLIIFKNIYSKVILILSFIKAVKVLFKTTLFYLFCLITEIWRNAVCIISIIVIPITIIVDIVEIVIIIRISRAERKNNSGDHVIIISTPISKKLFKNCFNSFRNQ